MKIKKIACINDDIHHDIRTKKIFIEPTEGTQTQRTSISGT